MAGASLTNDRILFFEHNGGRAARHRQWKISALAGQPWELYNIAEDRAELNDLAAKHPERVKQMAAVWQKMTKDVLHAPGKS